MSILLNYIEWKNFINELNSPTLENLETRRKFFEECDQLFISNNGKSIIVKCPDLNTEAILAALNK